MINCSVYVRCRDFVTHNEFNQRRHIEFFSFNRGNHLGVAKDRDAIGNFKNFFQVVRNKDHCDSASLQTTNCIKQTINVGAGQVRGGLIQNQNGNVSTGLLKCTSDSHTRPSSATKRSNGNPHINIKTEVQQCLLGPYGFFLPIDSATKTGLVTKSQGQVFHSTHCFNQTKVLVYEANSGGVSGLNAANIENLIVHGHVVTSIGLMESSKNLDQG